MTKKPLLMTKIEKAALDIACAHIWSGDRPHLMEAGDAGNINRISFTNACRDMAIRLMDPENPLSVDKAVSDDIPALGQKIEIWTDGSCAPNPGHGGWGVYAEVDGKSWKQLQGYGGENTTNNQMELKAAIEALKIIPAKMEATIYTDSQYVKNGLTEWMAGWISRGWKTSNKKPIKNKDLWVEASDLATNPNVIWKWVKAHNGNHGNEIADQLAGQGRKSMGKI